MIDYDPEKDSDRRLEIAEEELQRWQSSLGEKVDIAALNQRNQITHKWKALLRFLLCRELTFWRMVDLISDLIDLRKKIRILNSYTLLRNCYETMGLLIYLNLKIRQLLDDKIDLNSFEKFHFVYY